MCRLGSKGHKSIFLFLGLKYKNGSIVYICRLHRVPKISKLKKVIVSQLWEERRDNLTDRFQNIWNRKRSNSVG